MCTSSPLSFSLIDKQFSKVIISQYTFRFVTYIDVICIKISTKKGGKWNGAKQEWLSLSH